MSAVGEALEAHRVIAKPGEQMAATVARALDISEEAAERWIEALNAGATVEDANREAGILSHREDDPILVAIARAIGKFAGKIAG